DRFGPPRVPESEITSHHRDVAFGVQALTEEAALHMARSLHTMTGSRNLALSGGVALNSVMNARLLRETPFERIFVQPAAGDAGSPPRGHPRRRHGTAPVGRPGEPALSPADRGVRASNGGSRGAQHELQPPRRTHRPYPRARRDGLPGHRDGRATPGPLPP